jgi:hypothetical protein
MYAWAIRDGDVLRPIPEPTTPMLVAIAGFGLAATRMRRKGLVSAGSDELVH